MPTINKGIVYIITFYRKYLSKYKGYNCAYNIIENKKSCSTYALYIAKKHKTSYFLPLLNRRLKKCKASYDNATKQNDRMKKKVIGCCAEPCTIL